MLLLSDSYRIINDRQSTKLFNGALVVSQFCGVMCLLSVTAWMGGSEEGGFAWGDDPEKQFHYHPTFMAMGLIFLNGEAILVYRIFRKERKRFTKLLHLSIHSIAILFAFIALKAVWDSHDYHRNAAGEPAPIPNLYSLHSWAGITFFTLYLAQYAAGFVTFFIPGLAVEVRKFFLPFHQLFGVTLFVVLTATALMGISERAAWHHKCWTVEGRLCGQQLMANFLGVCLIGFCSSVLFIVMNPRWKRLPLPEEECLQTLENEE